MGFHKFAAFIIVLLVIAGCASSDVTERQSYVGDEEIARPGRIIVYNIAATPDEVPANSAIAGYYDRRATPQTAQEIETGHRLGDLIARELVKDILKMGLPAERAGSGPGPQLGDVVITGEFVSIDEGDRLARMLVGFGAGAAKLKTFVEKYQVTASGFRPLGSAMVEAGGGKLPGMIVPIGVGAATGNVVAGAAVSGAGNIAQELGPESIAGAAKRTADSIAELLREEFVRYGWI